MSCQTTGFCAVDAVWLTPDRQMRLANRKDRTDGCYWDVHPTTGFSKLFVWVLVYLPVCQARCSVSHWKKVLTDITLHKTLFFLSKRHFDADLFINGKFASSGLTLDLSCSSWLMAAATMESLLLGKLHEWKIISGCFGFTLFEDGRYRFKPRLVFLRMDALTWSVWPVSV